MAALASNVQRPRIPINGKLNQYKVKLTGYTALTAAEEIYKGAVLMVDVSVADGYATPKAVDAAAGDLFAGVAMERVSIGSADAANGAKECVVAIDGLIGFPKGALAITDLGAPIYASTDNDISTTDTNNLWIGYLKDIDDTYAYVDIAPAWMMANSAT